MRVFVTGASGFVGSAVVQELVRAGHAVTGLARSEASARNISAMGAKVLRGDLEDLASLMEGAAGADGVIHTGFNHDFSKYKDNCEKDRQAIETMASTLNGSDRPLIITSGIGLLSLGRPSTEEDRVSESNPNPRAASELAAQAMIDRGANISVVRLPPSVHGAGDHGFVPMLINMAKEKGVSAYIGEGLNPWSAVHRFDAARLYRLALEKATKGAWYHGVAEEGLAFRQIAEVIGRRLNMAVESKTGEDITRHFTWFAHFAAMNARSSSERTRKILGWQPREIGLLADMESYF